MKTLRVISSMNPQGGGPSQGIRYSIPALRALGWENEVVCLDSPNAPFLGQDNFIIHTLGAGQGPLHYHPQLIPWLKQHIVQYDVLIIHGLWSFASHAVTKVVQQRKRQGLAVPKVYVMPHGMLDPWFQRDKSRRLKALRNEIYWWLIEKKTVNQADGLLFTCQQELLLARETFKGYKPKQELNVGYGIQAPPAYTEKSTPPALTDKSYWLFLSRIHPKKGVDLLIHAYEKLCLQNGSVPDLVIAGPTDNDYAKQMVQLANSNPKIRFTGMLQGDAKWGALYGCEAFILPSHQENFGIAVVEALACRKPVLISDQVNIWREIEDGKGGIIARNTLEGTYQLLKDFYAMESEEKKRMGYRAYQVYQRHFTIQEAAEKLKNVLYEKRNP